MKKLKILVGAVALFALVVVNVWNAATVKSTSELDISNVESIAAEGDVYGGSGSYSGAIITKWIIGNLEDSRFFSMSGTELSHPPSSQESYIWTYYQCWDCAKRTEGTDDHCTAGVTRRYPSRVIVTAGNSGPYEGNTPYSHDYDGYGFPY